jgi:hypothetical protein
LLTANLNRNCCKNVVPLNVAATEDLCSVEIVNLEGRNIGANLIKAGTAGSAGLVEGRPILAILGDNAPKVKFIKIDIEIQRDRSWKTFSKTWIGFRPGSLSWLKFANPAQGL